DLSCRLPCGHRDREKWRHGSSAGRGRSRRCASGAVRCAQAVHKKIFALWRKTRPLPSDPPTAQDSGSIFSCCFLTHISTIRKDVMQGKKFQSKKVSPGAGNFRDFFASAKSFCAASWSIAIRSEE